MDHITRVLERRRAGHPDPYKVALCIEGGGMRGVVSAGMVAALQELDGARLFDHVYGSSAGALNGAYFLAGQAEQGLPIYFEDLPERRFVCWRRYLRGGPLLHLDDLIDEVMTNVRPLDFGALHRSRPTFHALAYDLAQQLVVAMPDPQDREGLFERLRASCRVPVFGGPPVVHGEHAWCDPLLHEPIPCRTPLALGATHLVVLSTRPTPAFSRAGVMQRSFEGRLLTRWDPRLAASMVADGTETTPYDDATLLTDLVEAGRALVIAPAGPIVGRLETDPVALRAGADRGRTAVMNCTALTAGAPVTMPAPLPTPVAAPAPARVPEPVAGPAGASTPPTGPIVGPAIAPAPSTDPGATPAATPVPSTAVVPVGVAAASSPSTEGTEDGEAPARRALPQFALDGVAWCRQSTRRPRAGASRLVERMPLRRRDRADVTGEGRAVRDPRPFAALFADNAGEVPVLPWRRARPVPETGDDEGSVSTARLQTTVWSHRVRSR